RLAALPLLPEDATGADMAGTQACQIAGSAVEAQGLPQVSLRVLQQAQLDERIAQVAVGKRLRGLIAQALGGCQRDPVSCSPLSPVPGGGEAPPQGGGRLPGADINPAAGGKGKNR